MPYKSRNKKIPSSLFIFSVFLFLYLPIIVLLVFSFNAEAFPSPWKSFSWKWYGELFRAPYLWQSFANSLIIAVSATCISLFLGVCFIFYLAQGGRIRRYISLYYGNLVIPETVLAVALLGFFTTLSIPLGLLTLVLAHTVLGVGFTIPMLHARYQEMDPRMTEASLDLGATPLQAFFTVTLPFLRPSLIATGLLVFILSFDDFILAYFCAGSSSQTLSLYILSMLRTGICPVVNALSAVLFLLSGLFALLFFSLQSRAKVF